LSTHRDPAIGETAFSVSIGQAGTLGAAGCNAPDFLSGQENSVFFNCHFLQKLPRDFAGNQSRRTKTEIFL
jgi:hypothetical protein